MIHVFEAPSTPIRPRAVVAALVVAALGASAVAADGQDGLGPEFGKSTFTTTIRPLGGIADEDTYVGRLIEGEQLAVTLAVGKKSSLVPDLAIFRPDGSLVDLAAFLKVKSNGRKILVKKLPVNVSGCWTVRVSGANETTRGEYSIAFKIKKAKPVKLKKQTLGGDALEQVHAFGGIDGSVLDLALVWSKKEEAVEVRALTDPHGGDVPANPAKALDALILKKTKATLKKQILATGDGEYGVRLGIAQGTATYTVTMKVSATAARPSGKVGLAELTDPLLAPVAEPVPGAAGIAVTFEGHNLVATQRVLFGGIEGTVVGAAPDRSSIEVIPPVPSGPGVVAVTVVGTDGQSVTRADHFEYFAPVELTTSAITTGEVIPPNEVPLLAGNRVVITGANLDLLATVRLGGAPITVSNVTPGGFEFDVPAGAGGPLDLAVDDVVGRTVTLPAVVRRVGFADVTGVRTPLADATDDFSAWRIALGDLDNDIVADDLALGSYNATTQYSLVPNGPGTRSELTRVLRHTVLDRLEDASSGMPATGSDGSGVADWNSSALAVGDLDGSAGDEIVSACGAPADWANSSTGQPRGFPRLRVFVNGGTGGFSAPDGLASTASYIPSLNADTEVIDTSGEEPVIVPQSIHTGRFPAATATAIALGDLDGDGNDDVVLGTSHYGHRYITADPADVDYSRTPPYILTADVTLIETKYYYAATRIFINEFDTAGGLSDTTEMALPSVGDDGTAALPAFHARDIAIGDIDGDDDQDLIVAWNNPASTTPSAIQTSYGRYFDLYGNRLHLYTWDGSTTATATRVLTNDGNGRFSDVTASWMPANIPSQSEFWHAHQVKLGDFDGDGDLDVALLHRRRLNAFKSLSSSQEAPAARSSLRILRNDRIKDGETGPSQFVDVTDAALPPFPAGTDDNWRGNTLVIHDVNRDGKPDLLVGTRERLTDDQMAAQVPSLRLLFGAGDLTFTNGSAFLPSFATDSGEADGLLMADLVPGLGTLVIVSEVNPTNSTSGQSLRAFDWQR